MLSSPSLQFENELWSAGVNHVAGIDEAGRGALAGPVAAAALILPPDTSLVESLDGVRDSKMMTSKARYLWADRLHDYTFDQAVGFASPQEIDQLGIVPATRIAIHRALDLLRSSPQHLLIDYLDLPDCSISHTSITKGDAICLSIAAASIIAKTARDTLMREYDQIYPGYGFADHKGYGTAMHRQSIHALGYSPIHRKSFNIKGLETIAREF